MGLIFDIHTADLYRAWVMSPTGQAMDRFVEKYLPILLAPRQGERILEIGCGTGGHLLMMSKFRLDLAGVDASPYMVDMAKKRLGSKCSIQTGKAEDLPFEDNEFDLAVFINTLEFLDDPIQALKEAGRVARRKIFITSINSLSPANVCARISSPFKKGIMQSIRPYNLWELKSYIQEASGNVPIDWRSSHIQSPFSSAINPIRKKSFQNPFGPFLGLSATITYRIMTDNLFLKKEITGKEGVIIKEVTSSGPYKRGNLEREIHKH